MIEALLCIGTIFIILGCVGVYRLPDALCRSHALTKPLTLGIGLILLATCIHLPSYSAKFKIILAIVFQFMTIPVGSHLLAMLVKKKGIPLWQDLNKK